MYTALFEGGGLEDSLACSSVELEERAVSSDTDMLTLLDK